MKCCICGKNIPPVGGWVSGNDAWPLADGRCCNECDMAWVVPARLGRWRGRVVCENVIQLVDETDAGLQTD